VAGHELVLILLHCTIRPLSVIDERAPCVTSNVSFRMNTLSHQFSLCGARQSPKAVAQFCIWAMRDETSFQSAPLGLKRPFFIQVHHSRPCRVDRLMKKSCNRPTRPTDLNRALFFFSLSLIPFLFCHSVVDLIDRVPVFDRCQTLTLNSIFTALNECHRVSRTICASINC